jgi:hypothetical protein
MPVLFTKGDLFATPSIRASVEFKRRFPRMFEEYAARCADGRFGLGDVFVWNEGDATVFNLGTQTHWKEKSRKNRGSPRS